MENIRIKNLATNRLNNIKRISAQLRAGTVMMDNIEIPNQIVWNNYTNRFVLNDGRNRRNIKQKEELRRNEAINNLQNNGNINIEFNNRTGSLIDKKKFLSDIRKKLSPTKKYIITLPNGKIYTLNNSSINALIRVVDNGFEGGNEEDSIRETYSGMSSSATANISLLAATNEVINGGFFPYFHNCDKMAETLERYDIHFSVNTMVNIKCKEGSLTENCLIRALISAGTVNEAIINSIKFSFKSSTIPQRELKELAEKHNLYITVKRPEAEKNLRKYGDKKNPEIKLGLIEGHYFLIEKTHYTAYAVENYHKINHMEDWEILNQEVDRIVKRPKRTIDSYALVNLLIKNKDTHLCSMDDCNTDFQKTEYFNEKQVINSLEYTDDDIKYTEYKPRKEKTNFIVEFIDFETFNMKSKDTPNKDYTIKDNYKPLWEKYPDKTIHKPFMMCATNQDGNIDTFITEKCGKKYLDQRVKRYGIKTEKYKEALTIIIYAHNAGYDIRFIEEHLSQLTKIENGHSLICASGLYKSFGKVIKIEIRDSYKLISSPLAGFNKMFSIEVQKEYMPYLLYNLETVSNGFLDYDIVKQFAEKEGKLKDLEECVIKADCVINGKMDMLKYAEFYCKTDVEVLQKGFNTFSGWIKTAIDVDVIDFYTIPSIAHEYFMREGCYDGTVKIAGVVREFINKCLLGGRTMMCENKKQNINNKFDKYSHKKIADFDAVSLYPSAMKVMRGFLMGEPNVIEDDDDWRNMDGFFVELKVTNIGKQRKFPMMNIMTSNGVRKYTDDINDYIGKTIYVDREMLSIFEEYHKIEYELVKGYYFDEGHNNKINEVIQNVFNQRLLKKNETILNDGTEKVWTIEECLSVNEDGDNIPEVWYEKNKDKVKSFCNPIQNIWKLIMNSGYGKSITKPHDTEDKYITGYENLEKHIYRNYNWVIDTTIMPCEWTDKYKVKQIKPINDHYNYAHIGIEILSQSKRIMADVMYLAEDNDINMYYTDTDSIHMDLDKVKNLGELFKSKYGKDLIGKGMGQFHTDFDLKGCKDIYSKRFIALGKKCYIDHLVGVNKKTNKVEEGYHIRLKGVPDKSVWNVVHKQFNGDPIKLYEKLNSGVPVSFDLTKGYKDGIKDIQLPAFEFHSNLLISNRDKFERVLKF